MRILFIIAFKLSIQGELLYSFIAESISDTICIILVIRPHSSSDKYLSFLLNISKSNSLFSLSGLYSINNGSKEYFGKLFILSI